MYYANTFYTSIRLQLFVDNNKMLPDYMLPPTGDNVIKTTDIDCEYDEGGLGIFMYKAMQQCKDNIAQIEVATGNSDTYASLLKKSVNVAIELKARGICQSDIVCLSSKASNDVCVAYFGALFAGAKLFSIYHVMATGDACNTFSLLKPSLVFTNPENEKMFDDVKKSLELNFDIVVFGETCENIPFAQFQLDKNEDDQKNFKPVTVDNIFDTAAIFCTSGITADSKLICVTHYSLMCQTVSFKLAKKKAFATFLQSPIWIGWALTLLKSSYRGYTKIIMPDCNAEQLLSAVEKYNIDILSLVSLYEILYNAKTNKPLHCVKYVITSGMAVPESILEKIRWMFPEATFLPLYGLTEVMGCCFDCHITSKTLANAKPNSYGRPVQGIWYKIVDLHSEENLGPNQEGELRIKSKLQMKGYFNEDSSVAYDKDGYVKTGDIFYYDDDYSFFFVCRIKDIIKYKDWRIKPAYLENILEKHSSVLKAAVIGLPDNEDIEHPMGVVILRDDAKVTTENELSRFVNEQVDESHKLRKGIKIVKELPYTVTGKINKSLLKEKIMEELKIRTIC